MFIKDLYDKIIKTNYVQKYKYIKGFIIMHEGVYEIIN